MCTGGPDISTFTTHLSLHLKIVSEKVMPLTPASRRQGQALHRYKCISNSVSGVVTHVQDHRLISAASMFNKLIFFEIKDWLASFKTILQKHQNTVCLNSFQWYKYSLNVNVCIYTGYMCGASVLHHSSGNLQPSGASGLFSKCKKTHF